MKRTRLSSTAIVGIATLPTFVVTSAFAYEGNTIENDNGSSVQLVRFQSNWSGPHTAFPGTSSITGMGSNPTPMTSPMIAGRR
jgi:hypothetical protein